MSIFVHQEVFSRHALLMDQIFIHQEVFNHPLVMRDRQVFMLRDQL